MGLQKEVDQMDGFMKDIQKEIKDAADPFKLRMPGMFDKTKGSVEGLIKLRDTTKEKYIKVLELLQMDKNMSGEKFCVCWDKFFCPDTKLLRFDAKVKSKFVIPAFCADKPYTPDDMQILWGIKEWSEPKLKKQNDGDEKGGDKEDGEKMTMTRTKRRRSEARR